MAKKVWIVTMKVTDLCDSDGQLFTKKQLKEVIKAELEEYGDMKISAVRLELEGNSR
jgi:hypothetical protein